MRLIFETISGLRDEEGNHVLYHFEHSGTSKTEVFLKSRVDVSENAFYLEPIDIFKHDFIRCNGSDWIAWEEKCQQWAHSH